MSPKRSYEVVTAGDIVKKVSIWIVDVIVVIALALVLTHLFGTRVRMEGSSMTPTLSGGDRILLNRAKGRILPIKRYDIIVYHLPGQEGVYLKRVLALPGETLQIAQGKVYINGMALPDSEYTKTLAYAGVAASPVTLREDDFRVTGSVKQGEELTVAWKDADRAYRSRKCIYLYAAPGRAFLLPAGQADVSDEEVWQTLLRRLGEKKCRTVP